MNIKNELDKIHSDYKDIQYNDINIDPTTIQTIMINEVVPKDEKQDFYGDKNPEYLKTTIPLFNNAGVDVHNINDILEAGIYITNAVKVPKEGYTIDTNTIKEHSLILEKEISLFPNVKVIMLMGDVAKKSFNFISKTKTKKNCVPAISTYKLRNTEIYYDNIRILPSYIMTGKNILIEKSKFRMASEDIALMMKIIKGEL
ncbi:MAG: uracil-DNA glycosylase [Coprobacillaceae bacterium]